jgi:hypothetical protein
MNSRKKAIAVCCALILAHAAVLFLFGANPPGPLLSDLIQVIFVILCTVACWQASRRGTGLIGLFWRLGALSFAILVFSQALQSYCDGIRAQIFIPPVTDILFVFWYAPLSAVLFFDSNYTPDQADGVHLFDTGQILLFWIAVYLCFSTLAAHAQTPAEAALSNWQRSLVYDGVLTGGFLLRGTLQRPGTLRRLFLGMGIFFFLAGQPMRTTTIPEPMPMWEAGSISSGAGSTSCLS